MGDETNEERQDNELAALQAIYGDAVIDNRETVAWKIWRPLDIMLTLHPLHNSDIKGVHCSVTLHFKCCASYPNKPPSLAIHKMHGISTDNGTRLLGELEEMATKLCGEVCIFQLAQHAQQFLHDHNKPTLSFYEEMVKQKTEQEQLKLHDMKVKENEERQKMKDEIQRRQEILRCAGRQRSHRASISQDNDCLDGQGDAPELVYYADDKMSPAKKVTRTRTVEVPCTCKNKGVQIIRVTQRNNRKVYIGNCLGHSSNGSTTYLAIDDEGERLIAKKWVIPPACDFQTRTRQLTSIQNDLKTMSRINHSVLIPYIAMETCKEVTRKATKQYICLFRNFVLGSSLKCIKKRVSGFSDQYEGLKLLRHVGIGLFSALKELHSVGLAHRDVRSENVFLDDFGSVKLVGVGLDMRMTEMLDGESFCDRQTSSQDIYATGQLLLSLLSLERTYLDVPPDLPTTAKDFFARCLTEDEHTQWTAEQLINHVFLVDAPAKVIGGKEKEDGGSGSEDDEAVKKIQHTSPVTNGHSRLHAEFEVLTWLGKGAFGDVLKVKNKLDGGFYAIKRIKLNPESVQLNKKITREVKLLSRLNHENVVRYYNAWIESTIEQQDEVDSSVESKAPIAKRPGDSLQGIVAKLGQEVKVEWSMSEGPVQKTNSTSDSEDDDEDDEQDPWFTIMNPEDESSSGIEFEVDSNASQTIPSEDVVDAAVIRSERLQQVLYIQMEFCEKHTLRQAIDAGLYHESYRAWRLFREIVEGLAHVHQRGMIHRDLKPVNIFLDSNDHVKIGDFGLATKAFTALPVDEKTKQEEIGGSLTGQIGTALYVAPELLQAGTKVLYNQKVDIYSLGIILFEMFHPVDTGMERMLVLTNLRSKEILLPKGFEKEENGKQIHVIKWLLNHEPSLRPTCADLLASEHVPRAVPEGALSGLLSHTLSDRGARGYQRLVAACLDQRLSAAEDYTYHNDMNKNAVLLGEVKQAVLKVFRSHGAIEFSPPLLIPRAKRWEQYPNAVKVMTASGSVCHLPHDLRLPFARHTAYTGTKYMRRYVVDRVYREKHVQGFHPREIVECAFDIVTPKTDSLWSDAELLVIASRAAMESNLKVSIQLNHTELLKTLLVCCGVPLDRHTDMYPVLVDVSLGRITSLQLQTHLTSLCVTNRDVSNLLRLMEADVSVHEVRELVTPLVKQAKWSKALSMHIMSLEALVRNAKALGCECPMTVAPFLAYNATQHNGVFWQMSVVRNTDHRPTAKHRAGDIIAAGGRYDALVEEFWKIARTEKDHDNCELRTCSVGFSMSLERMAAILKKMDNETQQPIKNPESTLICVCLWGTAGTGRDGLAAARRANLARDLWAAGYNCCSWTSTSSDAHELTKAGLVLLQDDAGVRIVCWDGLRLREHKVPYIDVLDFIKQKLNPDTIRSPESANRSLSWCESEKSNSCITSVTFITASDRMTKNSKRHCENQINTQITSMLVGLGLQAVLGRVRVVVLALACDAPAVRALAAALSAPLDTDDLERAFRSVQDLFPKRQNILDDAHKELASLARQSSQSRSSEETTLYALYSIPDSLCRLIT
ncbi:eukaryotic translation initiation factor 2 alpha kinase Gcn2 [Anticarsia gemmatalis]|uniref:eukaryotic translation initiation factor 2 alpha kinase Gcn2 n=1 Tax=Anticarsia gemmatalis TaxID=129554 RepID=UPI003F759596